MRFRVLVLGLLPVVGRCDGAASDSAAHPPAALAPATPADARAAPAFDSAWVTWSHPERGTDPKLRVPRCYRLAFGAWEPAVDVGGIALPRAVRLSPVLAHVASPGGDQLYARFRIERAPAGRTLADDWRPVAGDSLEVVFRFGWHAGVGLRLPAAEGDVTGVARWSDNMPDGRPLPRSAVRASAVPCPPAGPPDAAADRAPAG